MNNALSLTKIINGLSKTLSIANQLIPIYKQAKPYINKLNNINIPTLTLNNQVTQKTTPETKKDYNNQPTFFQ